MKNNLKEIISSTTNARHRIRLLAIYHFNSGKNRTQIAQYLQVSRHSVNGWVKKYLEQGLTALEEKKHPGRPNKLNEKQKEDMLNFIAALQQNHIKKSIQADEIRLFLLEKYSVLYQKSNIYKLLQ
ncbi:helix-turn-helix domain-containing protein [Psychromonas sp. CD1]|uniref:helix-turn-helix domain-containing protein n=1 Tax=Psychromonas sp. CD1 TaxID=1979839 RepID=UPI000B9C1563|nr:helix-turn-helix domain-containing protein [Psychromonas sp. CD1]